MDALLPAPPAVGPDTLLEEAIAHFYRPTSLTSSAPSPTLPGANKPKPRPSNSPTSWSSASTNIYKPKLPSASASNQPSGRARNSFKTGFERANDLDSSPIAPVTTSWATGRRNCRRCRSGKCCTPDLTSATTSFSSSWPAKTPAQTMPCAISSTRPLV